MAARIDVLAGVNGAGKSSIGGAAIESTGSRYFNPDRHARYLVDQSDAVSPEAANLHAWNFGYTRLKQALAAEEYFALETTLGGRSITDLLLDGAQGGARIRMWYCGLATPELHMARVASRVLAGGHDIPEAKIRERFDGSRRNLIRLLPHLAMLEVHDNSAEHDPKLGTSPQPMLLLRMNNGKLVWHCPIAAMPHWAKPILSAALQLR